MMSLLFSTLAMYQLPAPPRAVVEQTMIRNILTTMIISVEEEEMISIVAAARAFTAGSLAVQCFKCNATFPVKCLHASFSINKYVSENVFCRRPCRLLDSVRQVAPVDIRARRRASQANVPC